MQDVLLMCEWIPPIQNLLLKSLKKSFDNGTFFIPSFRMGPWSNRGRATAQKKFALHVP
jgi:hypothetical protein